MDDYAHLANEETDLDRELSVLPMVPAVQAVRLGALGASEACGLLSLPCFCDMNLKLLPRNPPAFFQ